MLLHEFEPTHMIIVFANGERRTLPQKFDIQNLQVLAKGLYGCMTYSQYVDFIDNLQRQIRR